MELQTNKLECQATTSKSCDRPGTWCLQQFLPRWYLRLRYAWTSYSFVSALSAYRLCNQRCTLSFPGLTVSAVSTILIYYIRVQSSSQDFQLWLYDIGTCRQQFIAVRPDWQGQSSRSFTWVFVFLFVFFPLDRPAPSHRFMPVAVAMRSAHYITGFRDQTPFWCHDNHITTFVVVSIETSTFMYYSSAASVQSLFPGAYEL